MNPSNYYHSYPFLFGLAEVWRKNGLEPPEDLQQEVAHAAFWWMWEHRNELNFLDRKGLEITIEAVEELVERPIWPADDFYNVSNDESRFGQGLSTATLPL